jgi:hypothetical protein
MAALGIAAIAMATAAYDHTVLNTPTPYAGPEAVSIR